MSKLKQNIQDMRVNSPAQTVKVVLTFAFLICIFPNLYGQQANVWYFGTKAGLDFNTTPPTPLVNGSIITPNTDPGAEGEGVASISDNNGNILFYTDGVQVFDRNHTQMPNGHGLQGHPSSAQSAIIVPRPGSPTRYYIFTAPLTNTTIGVFYSEVDMTLNGGNGDIIAGVKNVPLVTGIRMMEAICAVPHANETDFWVITHEGAGSNIFRSYQVTAAGVNTTAVTAAGSFSLPLSGSDIGLMKVNSCYTKIAVTYHSSEVVEVLNFDNSNATINTPLQITNFASGDGVYGLEFSPSDQYLFVTGLYNKILYQFDLTAANVNASRATIGFGHPSAERLAALQLGPDGKIYAANHSWGPYNDNPGTFTYVGVINNPNNTGAATNWVNDAIAFPSIAAGGSAYSGVKHGLPTLLKSFVANSLSVNKTDACLGNPIDFSIAFSGIQTGTAIWDFGDGSGTQVSNAPTHSYDNEGLYMVEVSVTDICGRTNTTTEPLNIVDARPEIEWTCGNNEITFTGLDAGTGNIGYAWFNSNNQQISDAASFTYTPASLPETFTVYGTTPSQHTAYVSHGTGYPQSNNWVEFNANESFTLVSVRVRPANGDAGCWSGTPNATFTLYQGASEIASRSIPITCNAGSQTVTLDFGIPAGTGYRLQSNIGFYYVANWEAGSFPWRDVPAVTYTGASIGTGGPFADWEIKVSAPCSAREFVLDNGNCTLPVELLEFYGKQNNTYSDLFWSTAIEMNNSHFIVERSLDAYSFEPIGLVKGQGNSSNVQQYYFQDKKPFSGINYYRLKQVDLDGTVNYSHVISIKFNSDMDITVYPNPSNGVYNVLLDDMDEINKITLINYLGQELIKVEPEMREFTLDLSRFSSSMFILQIHTPNNTFTKKLVKE